MYFGEPGCGVKQGALIQGKIKYGARPSAHRRSVASAASWIDGGQTNRRIELTGLHVHFYAFSVTRQSAILPMLGGTLVAMPRVTTDFPCYMTEVAA